MKNDTEQRVQEGPRVLIGTLYSGENELDESTEMLNRQSHKNWEHRIFANMKNKQAHDALYREFMERRTEFDLFVKLDADMVFRSTRSLETVVDMFRFIPDLDHLQTPVFDWYSDSLIPAFHVFSNRAVWEEHHDELFVDPWPTIPGRRITMNQEPAPFVNHSPNPSLNQAFLFGVHRAVKAVQPGREALSRGQAMFQWRILKSVWHHFERTLDRRLGMCVVGAELILRGELAPDAYVNGNVDKGEFSRLPAKELYRLLSRTWQGKIYRELRHKRLIGLRYVRSLLRRPPNLRRLLKKSGELE